MNFFDYLIVEGLADHIIVHPLLFYEFEHLFLNPIIFPLAELLDFQQHTGPSLDKVKSLGQGRQSLIGRFTGLTVQSPRLFELLQCEVANPALTVCGAVQCGIVTHHNH